MGFLNTFEKSERSSAQTFYIIAFEVHWAPARGGGGQE